MVIQIQNGELAKVSAGLSGLLDEKIPARMAFKVSRIADAVNAQKKTYEEIRQRLIETHAKRGDDGEFLMQADGVSVDVERDFFIEMQELNEEYGDEIQTISAKELLAYYDSNDLQIRGAILYNLGELLVDDLGE